MSNTCSLLTRWFRTPCIMTVNSYDTPYRTVTVLTHPIYCIRLYWHRSMLFSFHSLSRGRGHLHELTPCRSIQSVPDRPQPFSTRFASVYRFCIASLWEDPEFRPEELENGLHWCRYDKGGQRKTGNNCSTTYYNFRCDISTGTGNRSLSQN